MQSRRFRPSVDAFEARLLLSTAHHPAPYTGTVHGLLKVPATTVYNRFETYKIVAASGSIAPYGSVQVILGSAVDHGLGIGSIPQPNTQSINFDIARHGKIVAAFFLTGQTVPLGTKLKPGRYATLVYDVPVHVTETATLSLPKGLPNHTGQTTPFTLTFTANK